MAQDDIRVLRRGERGLALLLVLAALAMALVLVLVVSKVALSRRVKATAYRETLARQIAVRGALDSVRERLFTKKLVLSPDRVSQFELGAPLAVAVRVRVARESDAVVTLDGRVLRGLEASGIDVAEVGMDGTKRTVHPYRRLQVYLVEAEAEGGPSFPAVRLLGGLARLDDGSVLSLGFRYDRGYF